MLRGVTMLIEWNILSYDPLPFSVSADICAILALTTTNFDVDKTIHAPNLIFPSKNDTLVLKKQGKFITPLEI